MLKLLFFLWHLLKWIVIAPLVLLVGLFFVFIGLAIWLDKYLVTEPPELPDDEETLKAEMRIW